MKQSRAEYEDDSISITSSQSEEYTSDQEFLVERILAEKKGEDGEPYFLIFWANYPEEKSTWEPEINIQDPDILQAWNVRKDQETKGLKPAFDLARFNARVRELVQAKEDRRRRRKMKRKRRGIPVSLDSRDDDLDSTEAVESDGAPEGYRGIGKKRKPVQKPEGPTRTPPVQSESPNIEARPRKRSNVQRDSYDSDGAGSSDDSLMQDFKQKEERKKRRKQALQALKDKRTAQDPSKAHRTQQKSAAKKFSEVSAKSTRQIQADRNRRKRQWRSVLLLLPMFHWQMSPNNDGKLSSAVIPRTAQNLNSCSVQLKMHRNNRWQPVSKQILLQVLTGVQLVEGLQEEGLA